MVCLDFISVKARSGPLEATVSALGQFAERLFLAWIGFAAAGVFLISLFLVALQLISFWHLFYVYLGMSIITLVLAGMLYFARRDL